MRRAAALVGLCAGIAVGAAGCNGSSSSTPTTPTTTAATSSTQVFSNDSTPGDTPVHAFTLPSTAPLHLTFGSLTDSTTGRPLGSAVTFIYGVPNADGTVCTPLASRSTTAALTAQFNVTASAGNFCVGLRDTASVPASFHYAIRIVYGTPTDGTSAGTADYASTVVPTGSTARTFLASAAGTATVTMVSLSPASVSALGLGLGFQRNDASGCEIASAITATSGAALSLPLDAGKYCVKVFDPGTLTGPAAFTIRIVYP